jgi:hypothetical protein
MIATTRRSGGEGALGWVLSLRIPIVVLFLLLLLSDRTVLSSASSIPTDPHRSGGYDDISNIFVPVQAEINRFAQVQAEILQLTNKGATDTLNFDNKIKSINAKARKDISDADFYSCSFTDAPCLYQCIKKLKQAERKLQRRIIRAKENREKYLSKHKLDLEAKEKELTDLQRLIDVQGGPTMPLITTSDETDYNLEQQKSSTRMDENCTINGLTTDDLLENEVEKFIEIFQAIVNLGYTHTGIDRICLNDEAASSNRRNLRRRIYFVRGVSGACRSCPKKGIGHDDEGQMDSFVKFVNEYLAGVITSIVPPNRIAPNTLIEVSCMFKDVY